MRSGPICHLCGTVVPIVSWVILESDAATPGGDEAAGSGAPPPGALAEPDDLPAVASPVPEPAREVGLCADCLSLSRARGRLLAPVIPLRSGSRRRRRRPTD